MINFQILLIIQVTLMLYNMEHISKLCIVLCIHTFIVFLCYNYYEKYDNVRAFETTFKIN